jgi:hypothetical protein
MVINILSLKVFTNEKQQLNSKKKAKIEQNASTSINRRSISNKAFIEIYFLNNKNDLKLFGKCEISNLIENNSSPNGNTIAANECKIEIENLKYFKIDEKNVLFFRLIFIKDVEIEFSNTFQVPIDIQNGDNHPIYCINMYEMTNENNKLFDLINDIALPTKLFHSLPILKFKIDLIDINNQKIKTRSKISPSSSSSSSLYLSPLSSPNFDSKNENRKSPLKSTKKENKSKSFDLYYQFIGKNNFKVLTKFERHDLFVCPFCYLNCKCFNSLLKHLSCNHFRFQIESIVSVFCLSK